MSAGLCESCRHARAVVSGRGSTFWQCERSRSDRHFAHYPRLPVLRCPGHEAPPSTPGGDGGRP